MRKGSVEELRDCAIMGPRHKEIHGGRKGETVVRGRAREGKRNGGRDGGWQGQKDKVIKG